MVTTNFVVCNAFVLALVRVSKQLLNWQVVFQRANSVCSLRLLRLLWVLFLLLLLVPLLAFLLGIVLAGLVLLYLHVVLHPFDFVLVICYSRRVKAV